MTCRYFCFSAWMWLYPIKPCFALNHFMWHTLTFNELRPFFSSFDLNYCLLARVIHHPYSIPYIRLSRFTKNMNPWQKSYKNYFSYNLNSNDSFRRQFCTWHGSWAVVPYAKLSPDLIIIFHITPKNVFMKYGWWAHKTLVKRFLSCHKMLLSLHCLSNVNLKAFPAVLMKTYVIISVTLLLFLTDLSVILLWTAPKFLKLLHVSSSFNHEKPRVIMMPTFLSLAAPEIVLMKALDMMP